MSQHSDILSLEISKGIRNKVAVRAILTDIGDLLSVLEYTDDWCAGSLLNDHVYSHARWMRTQRDGLYGISYVQLDDFLGKLEDEIRGLDFV